MLLHFLSTTILSEIFTIGRVFVFSQEIYRHAAYLNQGRSKSLPTLHYRIANATQIAFVHLIGRSWRTWQTNRSTPSYLVYLICQISIVTCKFACPHILCFLCTVSLDIRLLTCLPNSWHHLCCRCMRWCLDLWTWIVVISSCSEASSLIRLGKMKAKSEIFASICSGQSVT